YLDCGTKTGNSHAYQWQTVANGQFFRMNLGPLLRKEQGLLQVCNIDKDKVENIDPKADWKESPGWHPELMSWGPLEYFPDRKSLLTIDTSRHGEVYERGLTAEKWGKVATVAGLAGSFGVPASYNPVHKVVVFGGGVLGEGEKVPTNRKWYQ